MNNFKNISDIESKYKIRFGNISKFLDQILLIFNTGEILDIYLENNVLINIIALIL